ncbi:Zinc finger C2H2-type [Trinorchestia longiramus]|nr:Zinc finger C2H2-type [Trinorchestia longiramus]
MNIQKCSFVLHNISHDAVSEDKNAAEKLHEESLHVFKTQSSDADSITPDAPSNVLPLFPAVYIKEELSDDSDGCDESERKAKFTLQESASGPAEMVQAAEASYEPGWELMTCKKETDVPAPATEGDGHSEVLGKQVVDKLKVSKSHTSSASNNVIHGASTLLDEEAAGNPSFSSICQGSVSFKHLDSEEQKPHNLALNASSLVFNVHTKSDCLSEDLVQNENCDYSFDAEERKPSDAFSSSDTKRFQCTHCRYSSSHKGTLMRHMLLRHSSVKPFQCLHCNYSSALKSNILRHTMVKHSITEPYQCLQCEFSSDKINSLKLHTREKHFCRQSFQCFHCDFWSVNKTSLRRHIMSKHTGDRPFQCTQCKYSSAYKFHLKTHILIKHSNVRPFQCGQCVCAFATANLLKRHVMIKHSQSGRFCCALCDYSTSVKVNIDKHNAAKHSGVKSYKCTQCAYSSRYKCNLSSHVKAKHTKRKDPHRF